MGAPHSLKVREQIVDYVDKGNSMSKAARHFGVGKGTVSQYMKLAEKGKLTPKPTGGQRPKKFTDEQLLNQLDKNPSITQRELGAIFDVSHTAIGKRIHKLNLSFKKKRRFTAKETKKKERIL